MNNQTQAISLYKPICLFFFLFIVGLVMSACDRDDDDMMPGNTGDPNNPDTTMVVNPPVENLCDSTVLPIVMMHGFLASGDTYALQVQRFTSNNYCPDRLYAFDWNSLSQTGTADLLDAFIDEILQNTGATQINLVGHSAGGGIGYDYLSDATRAAKVAHYAHLGSNANAQPAGPNGDVPTINIWSEDDLVVQGGDIPDATNVQISDLDHYEVATSAATFEAMYEFFHEELPASSQIEVQENLLIGGRALTLGENVPLANATIEIYALDASTGFRVSADSPTALLTTDEKGYWSGFEAEKDTYYEFFLKSADPNDRLIHYFREPFTHAHNMVYLRGFPPATSLAGILLGGIPEDDNQTALAIFSANKAVIDQRDDLTADGFQLSNAIYTPAEKTIIAFFLYDEGNGQTDGTIHTTFTFLQTFLTGIDVFIPASDPSSIELNYNDKTMFVPNLKSGTDGVMVAVFD